MLALACLVTTGNAQARGDYSRSDRVGHLMHVRGPGFADERAAERANGRAMRQAARGQHQQQMDAQRAARPEQMQRPPERELVAPQSPGFRPPDPGEGNRMGRPGRLTPEERRALREQINQADRDVYRPTGRP